MRYKRKTLNKIKQYLVAFAICLLPAIANAQIDEPSQDFDVMTQEKCEGAYGIILLSQGISFEERTEIEKITTLEVVKDIACVTKVDNKITGMYLASGKNITVIDPLNIERILSSLNSL